MGPVTGVHDAPTDIDGIAVGHHHRIEPGWATGTTVIVAPPGTVGAVDVGGGGPATRETDALAVDGLVQDVDAVCLTGGSAYGLDVAGGVMAELAAADRGFRVGPEPGRVVPIVPTAALFDLGVIGGFDNRPDAEFGRLASRAASGGPVEVGSVGAGAGATAGALRGGIGAASLVLPSGATVAALVALNSAGSPFDPATGRLLGARHVTGGALAAEIAALPDPSPAAIEELRRLHGARAGSFNTTLAVIVTDAEVSKPECARIAASGHDGMARALDPIHDYVDGDICFALATGAVPLGDPGDPLRPEGRRLAGLRELRAAAADAVTRAIVSAVLAATSAESHPSYRSVLAS